MSPLDILCDRLALLRSRLDTAEGALGLTTAMAFDWVQQEFANTIARRREELSQQDAGQSSNLTWHAWSGQERTCKPLFTEALAWLQAGGRPALEPTGPAMLARALVRELAARCGLGVVPVVAPDVGDSFSDFVPIIRIRFPPGNVWDVAVVAHEFGHFAAGYLNSRSQTGAPVRTNAFQGFMNAHPFAGTEQQRRQHTFRLNEFFADIFATYTVGPAFAMSALLLRFDVAQAYSRSDSLHPSYAERAAAILEAMALLSCDDKGLTSVTDWLGKQWSALLESAESKTGTEEAKTIAGDLIDIMSSVAGAARYRGWPETVWELQEAFMESKPLRTAPSPRDLLNAAWMARTYGLDQARVADRASELWRRHCNE